MHFLVGTVHLGIPAEVVEEVRLPDAGIRCAVPHAPLHVPGLVELRGKAVPLLDLRIFLDLPAAGVEQTREAHAMFWGRITVVSHNEIRVGIICDRVYGVVDIDRAQFVKPTIIQGNRLREFTTAEFEEQEKVIAVLEIGSLLEAARIKS